TKLDDRCGASGIRNTGDEVSRVVIRVCRAVVRSEDRGRVARRRGIRRFGTVSARTITDEIDYVGIAERAIAYQWIEVINEPNFSARAAHVDRAHDIRRG